MTALAETAGGERMPVHVENVMGTAVSFHIWPGTCPSASALSAVESACTVLHEADRVFSTWDPVSPMSLVRAGKALSSLPPEMDEVLALCRLARQLSGGWFDPWQMPGGVDPTGLVKGWAAERALGVLESNGVQAAMINAGGDVALFGALAGNMPWRVGIRHPWRPAGLACILEVNGPATRAVATSGSYERGAHLLDPNTGAPTLAAASATVTGPSLAIADALATGLAVGGEVVLDRIAGLDGYEAYLVTAEGRESSTSGVVFGTP